MAILVEQPRSAFRCAECGYGAAVPVPPSACPMCRRARWTRAGSDVTVTRLGNEALLVEPPLTLDSAACASLSETVAELVHEHHEVLVDLTVAEQIDDAGARLLLRLGALAHGAGGRLLGVCRSESGGYELHELTAGDGAFAGVAGHVGSALRTAASPVGD